MPLPPYFFFKKNQNSIYLIWKLLAEYSYGEKFFFKLSEFQGSFCPLLLREEKKQYYKS